MAAGDPKAFTNSPILSIGTRATATMVAADADTADLAQVFNYTPTGKDNKILVLVDNATGILAYSIAAGAGVFKAAAAKTGTVAANTLGAIQIETGPYINASGVIAITLTPASGTKLLTNHAAAVAVVELL